MIKTLGSSIAGLQNAGAVPTLVRKTVTFTGGAGAGATGTVAVFTVTGDVLVYGIWIKCTTDLVDTVDGAVLTFGYTGATSAFMSAPADLDTIDAGDFLDNTGGDLADLGYNLLVTDPYPPAVLSADMFFTVGTQAINSGVLEVSCLFAPLSAGASVVAA